MSGVKSQANSAVALSDGEQLTDMVFCQHEQLFFFASSKGDIKVKSLDSTRKVPETWGTHTGGIKYLLSMPDKYKKVDKIISVGNDSSVWLWQVGKGNLELLKVLHGFQSVFKPNLVAAWPEPVPSPVDPPPLLHFMAFVTPDGALNWWDLDSYTSHTVLLDGVGAITAMDFDEYEDLMAVGTAGGGVMVFRLSTLSSIMTTSTKGVVTNLRFRPIRELKAGASRSVRRLAIATSYDTSVKECEFSSTDPGKLGKPLKSWEYPSSDGAVFDLWPLNDQNLAVAFKNGSTSVLGLDEKPTKLDEGIADETASTSALLQSAGKLVVSRVIPSGKFSAGPGVAFAGLSNVKDNPLRPLRGLPTVGVRGSQGSIFPIANQDIFEGKAAMPIELTISNVTEATKLLTDKLLELREEHASDDNQGPCEHHGPWRSTLLDKPRVIHDPDTSKEFFIGGGAPGASAEAGTAISAMPTDPERRQEFASLFAHYISWEVFKVDHKEAALEALKNVVDIPPWFNSDLPKDGKSPIPDTSKTKSKGSKKNEPNKIPFDKFWQNFVKEKSTDTVAVGLSRDGKTILIAGNVKKRSADIFKKTNPGKSKAPPTNFGFHDNRHEDAIRRAAEAFPETENAKILVIGPETVPSSADINAERHAEMQIVSYSKAKNLDIQIIGISKPACEQCSRRLVAISHVNENADGKVEIGTRGTKQVKNWLDPEKASEFGDVKDIKELPPPGGEAEPEAPGEKPPQRRPLILSKDAFTPRVTVPDLSTANTKLQKVRNVLYHQNRPRIQADLGAAIENVVDNFDRPAFSEAEATVADAGVYETRLTRGVYAQAGVGFARAGDSVAEASARGPNVAAGAQVGALSGVALYARAEVAKVEASVAGIGVSAGLQFDNGLSIGPTGLSAEALGFGFSLGPELAIETPVASIRCSIM